MSKQNDDVIISNCFEKTIEGQKALQVLKKWAGYDAEIHVAGMQDVVSHSLGKRSLIIKINKSIENVRRN